MAEQSNGSVQHRLSTEGADHQMLAGAGDANLIELGRISGCRVVMRDNHLLLSGPLAEIERVVPVAQHMIDLSKAGSEFGADDISRFADVAGGSDGALTRIANGSRIVVPGARRAIAPKSEGQQVYLTAIEENDIVVGIGPAGTGKTYLAVAAAVDALAKKRVKRIILARPAVEAGENLGFLRATCRKRSIHTSARSTMRWRT